MAITWTPTIQIINLDREEGRLTAVREDDNPETGSIRTYTATGPMKTMEEKKAVADAILRQFHNDVSQKPIIAAKITELQDAAKTYLEANDAQ